MASNGRLYRNFIILQEDERGYASASDKALSGYSKIEAKGDKCKISFYAQNLKKENDKYHMMLICCKKDSKQIVDLGPVSVSDSGKCDITKEYNASNIAGLDLNFEKISGAAIAKYINGAPIFIMCGFLNGEQPSDDWKSYKIVKCKEEKNVEAVKPAKSVEKKVQKKVEKKIYKEVDKPKCDAEVEKKCEEKVEKEKCIKKEHDDKCEEKKKDNKCKEREDTNTLNEKQYTISNGTGENLRGKFDEYEEIIEVNKEFNPKNCKIKGPIGEYFESLVSNFETYDEGFKEIKYCKWYKVPVQDLYEMCNMTNYNQYTLAYYPMINYYPYIKKYGYFLLGYKCDSKGNLAHIVYGIPGKKDKNEQPYDGKTGFVTWTNGGTADNVGCWLMFYDYKNSTVVVPMQ